MGLEMRKRMAICTEYLLSADMLANLPLHLSHYNNKIHLVLKKRGYPTFLGIM